MEEILRTQRMTEFMSECRVPSPVPRNERDQAVRLIPRTCISEKSRRRRSCSGLSWLKQLLHIDDGNSRWAKLSRRDACILQLTDHRVLAGRWTKPVRTDEIEHYRHRPGIPN